MFSMNRQDKWREIRKISMYELESSIRNAINFLDKLKKQYETRDIRLIVKLNILGDPSFSLQHKDKETDEELETRLKNEDNYENRIKNEEKKLVARLDVVRKRLDNIKKEN